MNLPFEGDTYIKGELIKLRDKFRITRCVETGTQYGSTTLELYDIFGDVTTVEADGEYLKIASERLCQTPVSIYSGKSEDLLYSIVGGDTLYYLDAHGCEIGGCPLKKELQIIAGNDLSNICIAIHDFKNPDHPEFGFDKYDYELCFEEIEPYIKDIYPGGFEYHYNSQADGAMRGIIYIYPKIKHEITN